MPPQSQKAPDDGLDRSISLSLRRRSQPQMRQQDPLSLRHPASRNSTNPNIFSDDYALENETADSPTAVVRQDSIPRLRPLSIASNTSSLHLFSSHTNFSTPTISPLSADIEASANPFDDNARSSVDNSPRGSDIRKSTEFPQSHASISTESSQSHTLRMSLPRSIGAYSGPSHPYAMYPQVGLSRSASTATTATVRPPSVPLQGPSAPQHPYAMYQQNTTMDGEEATTIAVGFPSNIESYPTPYPNPTSRPDEVGDIIGPEGHLEQLPPYSRYPDGIPPKQGMGAASIASVTREQGGSAIPEADVEPSEDSPTETQTTPNSTDDGPRFESQRHSATPPSAPREKEESKANVRMCCGMPLWLIMVVGAGVLIGGLIGGVIGGVLGERRAQALAAASSSPSVVTVTYTADVTPLPTLPPGSRPLPTGRYQVPVNINNISRFCIVQQQFTQAWKCMSSGDMEIIVNGYATYNPTVEFPIPVFNTSNLRYGPQPPFLSSPIQSLRPIMDKYEPQYGPALFFASPFDKLVILPGNYFPPMKRWEVPPNQNHQPPRFDQVSQTDSPWFCWWNSTAMEFFIFVNDAGPSATSTITTAEGGSTLTSTITNSANMGMETGANPTNSSKPAPIFPRRVKVEEKRMLVNAPQPSCVRMTPSGSIYEPSTSTLIISEKALPTGTSKRDYFSVSTEGDLSGVDRYSDICYCEWLSD